MAEEDVLSMSLDDIIKQKSSGDRRGTGRNRRGSGSSRGQAERRTAVANSGVRKPRGGGTRRGGQVSRGEPLRSAPRNPDALNGDAAWEHDLFEGGAQPRKIRPAASGYKLLITNLDYKVTDEDILELFESCGPIKKAGIVYDRSGRSEEAAEVIFDRREDALAAAKRYNNLALDNKPMKIQLIENTGLESRQTLSSGIRIGEDRAVRTSGLQRGRRPQGSRVARISSGNRQNGGERTARGRGAVVSQADLDKDLDTFMAGE